MKVTRDVVSDLWPLYAAGEASADTRTLVDEFLVQDPEFAPVLRQSASPDLLTCPALPPDHETRTFDRTRRRLHGHPWLYNFAVLFTALAFGRIVADTSWDVSPRNFIIHVVIAACLWTAYLFSRWIFRRSALRARVR